MDPNEAAGSMPTASHTRYVRVTRHLSCQAAAPKVRIAGRTRGGSCPAQASCPPLPKRSHAHPMCKVVADF